VLEPVGGHQSGLEGLGGGSLTRALQQEFPKAVHEVSEVLLWVLCELIRHVRPLVEVRWHQFLLVLLVDLLHHTAHILVNLVIELPFHLN
jgi:hypothetical protein